MLCSRVCISRQLEALRKCGKPLDKDVSYKVTFKCGFDQTTRNRYRHRGRHIEREEGDVDLSVTEPFISSDFMLIEIEREDGTSAWVEQSPCSARRCKTPIMFYGKETHPLFEEHWTEYQRQMTDMESAPLNIDGYEMRVEFIER